MLNIGGKERGTSIDILCGNEIVGHSDKLKLLGVTIDNQLNFSENISQLCQKASRQVGVLMQMKELVPERAKLVIYRSSIGERRKPYGLSSSTKHSRMSSYWLRQTSKQQKTTGYTNTNV